MKKLLPYLMIALGASLWGGIALFVRGLKDLGLTEMEIVTIRVTFASLFLLLIGVIKYRHLFRIQIRKLPLFLGTGILSIVFFNWCYFTTINLMNISLAVVLLYTSPAFVAILSFIFLKESLHTKKIMAVIGTIIGCMLVTGLHTNTSSSITIIGLIIGLGSGFGYALYSIFGKVALRHYAPFTVTLYTFLVAMITLLPLSGIWNKGEQLFNPLVLMYGAGLGLIPTVIAYFAYTWGLEKTESSKAAVIATVEPIVATIVGLVLYDEQMTLIQLIGSTFIILSVVIINLPNRKNKKLLAEVK